LTPLKEGIRRAKAKLDADRGFAVFDSSIETTLAGHLPVSLARVPDQCAAGGGR
jgi:hypothetical protein